MTDDERDALRDYVIGLVKSEVAALPPAPQGEKGDPGEKGMDGTDGKDGDRGADGAPGLAGEPGLRGEKGMDGKDGRDGRDGKDGITERQMDEAVALAVAKVLPDALTAAVHEAVTKALSDYRLMTYKGVWDQLCAYEPGHTVTWAGSLWHCNEATTEKPGEGSKHWTLAAKRGRDGKDMRDGKER